MGCGGDSINRTKPLRRTAFRAHKGKRALFAERIAKAWKRLFCRGGFGHCMRCGNEFPAKRLHPHEIFRGQWRQACQETPAALLLLDDWCHTGPDGVQDWPLEKQLALKQRADPEHYDLVAILKIRWPKTWEQWVAEIEAKVAAVQSRESGKEQP